MPANTRTLPYLRDSEVQEDIRASSRPSKKGTLPAASVRKLLRESVLPRISMHATSAKNMVAQLLGHPLWIQGQIRCEVTNIVISTPLSLAEQVRDLPPDVLIPVPLAQDNRTISMFYLDRDVDTPAEDST
jgi:hypothetical protein